MAVGPASLKKTSWYPNIIILLGVEEHPNSIDSSTKYDEKLGKLITADFKYLFLVLPKTHTVRVRVPHSNLGFHGH